MTIPAHHHPLANIVFSSDGKYMATCSEKGTMIRIFEIIDTKQYSLRNELRRGSDPAKINCLCFNEDSSILLVSSDRGTIHLFNTEIHREFAIPNAKFHRYGLQYVTSVLPQFFSDKWSFANIYFPISSQSLFLTSPER